MRHPGASSSPANLACLLPVCRVATLGGLLCQSADIHAAA